MRVSSLADAEAALAELSAVVDSALRSFFDRLPATAFYDLMRYHLGWKDEQLHDVIGWGGKRLRPAMCLLVSQATSGQYERAMPAAMAIELLHNFTLIHDDIEDGDPIRRNRPAVWSLWGLPQAMNVGDGMHALAKMAAVDNAGGTIEPGEVIAVSTFIDETSLRVCEGQYLDLLYQDVWDVSVEQYLGMVQRKSAALLGCATYCGAMLGGADEHVRQCYREFGELIGMAFQIKDDVLAIWGEQSVTGKPSADLKKRKKTLPLIYARERAASDQAELLNRAFHAAGDAVDVDAVYEVLQATEAEGWSIAQANDYRDRALKALDATGIHNPAQEALREIARFVVDRSY